MEIDFCHGKQGWNLFSEEYSNGFMPTHSDPSGFRGDGKYIRNSRERGYFSRNDWRGHHKETASPCDRGRLYDGSDQRSVDDTHPPSDFVNSWDQLNCKDQHDKISSVNGLGTGQRFERENSLGSKDWKSLKWSRSGFSSRGSSFSHSSSSKSIGVDSNEAKADMLHGNATPVQLPSWDAGACITSTAPSEESHPSKKPRLGWGEGLAKYEKKKVEGPDGATKNGMVNCASTDTEPIHSHVLNSAEKSPRVAGLSDSASPATPSSFSCCSSPGVEDKPFVKTEGFDNDTGNLGGSQNIEVQDPLDGLAFSLENVELTSIANLSSSLSRLLQFDDLNLVGPGFLRSTATKKLLVWKGDVLKALEMTESEIDLLENELRSLLPKFGSNYPCPASSSSMAMKCQTKPCEEVGAISNLISRPAPLQVFSGDMIVEKAVHDLEEHTEVKDQDIDSPGTVTSKFIKPLSVNLATLPTDVNSHCKGEDKLYDLILARNKDSACRASEAFKNLLPPDQSHIDILGANGVSCGQNNPLIKERFATRKRFLRFKERVRTLKFRALQHLWKEDVRLLSVRKYRAKSQKRSELSSRTAHIGYQKHRSSIRSRISSAGNLCLVPTTEIIDLMGKLLSDSKVKLYRNTLKMPALILDKEKMTSRFISNNGLVEDPCGFEKERAMVNPWTSEEKEIFMDKLATLGKDFRKISSFLSHKTTADCIEFYYKNHKSDCFEKTKKKSESAKKGKSYSTNSYMVTSGRRWNHEMNAASLSMLGAASAIAGNADDGTEVQQKCMARFVGTSRDCKTPAGGDGILERSSSERETVAADVLAGICCSLSSEAMSSCITSSFDPGEGYQEWKCQKVGSLNRRPLTPEVTQNVDDETCSDESYEEMDPSIWTDEEKSIFIQAVTSYGKDFAMISRCVRTRSRDQCKAFFSKARKCLGLDMIHPVHSNEGMEDDANGGGSDTEDACVVETGSVVCSDKSASNMDEDKPFSDLKINLSESDPVGTMNLQIDMKKSKENNVTGQKDCKDPKSGSENLVIDDCLSGKLVLDFDGDCTIENDANSKSVTVKAHTNAVLFSDTETGQDEPTGDLLEDAVSLEEGNDCCLSASGAENETKVLGQVSAELVRTGLEEQQLSQPENNLKDKPDENNNYNGSGQSGLNCARADPITIGNTNNVAADVNSSSGFGANHKILHEVALESDPTQEPCVISLQQQDGCLVIASSVPRDSVAIQNEKIGDEQRQKSFSANDDYKYLSGEQARDQPRSHSRSLSDVEKPASFQRFSKFDRNFYSEPFLSRDYYFRKCNSSKTQSARSDVSCVSREEARDHPRLHSRSLSDVEKPSRNGDVKLFGQILSNPSSQQKLNFSALENEDKRVQNPKLSNKSSNVKLGTHSMDGNLVPAKLDRDNYLGLENLPRRSYGFWDRNRIKTGFHSLPDSAILLAKYPAAFGYASSLRMEQQPLHSVVKVNGHNLNGLSVFPTREIGCSNGVADFQVYRNWDDTKVQPFTIDMKQQQAALISEMERRNGFEAVPSIQQQGMGMVGIDVGRGGILVGGACNGVSDPVAAIRMHYAKAAERYGGQAGTIFGEDSWRGKGGR
ncbi:uncharacterized protein LOC132271053 isoform X2 [Cornus florida]|uniref:uncharacterized protein LOC132271053 isoform X2 n=1 Tax=Cornus florida TaxID=4283 RepID=UPI00289D76C5|nr:uncharacterized protein LOC132271053 isoform X2 [Cornus florida]